MTSTMIPSRLEADVEFLVQTLSVDSPGTEVITVTQGVRRRLTEMLGSETPLAFSHFDWLEAVLGPDFSFDEFLRLHQGTNFLNPNSEPLNSILLTRIGTYKRNLSVELRGAALLYCRGLQNPTCMIEDCLHSEDLGLKTGYFGIGLISKSTGVVVKIPRDKTDSPANHQPDFTCPKLDDGQGQEFIPAQAVIEIGGKKCIVQEFLELDEYKVLNVYNYEMILEEFAPIISLDPANKAKLRCFVEWLENVKSQHNMQIDLIGDNCFVKVDRNGKLDIKFVDTGECWDIENPDDAHSMLRMEAMIARLKTIV